MDLRIIAGKTDEQLNRESQAEGREIYALLQKIDRGEPPTETETALLATFDLCLIDEDPNVGILVDGFIRDGYCNYLRFSGLSILTLPESFCLLVNLKHIECFHATITALPESFSQLANLQKLDLSSTQITALPEYFGQLSNLQELNLNNTQITALPESFGQLSNLQELNLNNTQITALPESFGQLSNLQNLDLSFSRVTALPESFGQLSKLQRLNLGRTQITALPEYIGQLSMLQQLDLWGTPITSLPKFICQLSNLQKLDLWGTHITALPEYFGQILNLQSLNLGDTRVTTLPESFGQLANLQSLNLGDTRITTLPESFGQLANLQDLDLSDSWITALPDWLGRLPTLRSLDLSGLTLPGLPASLTLRELPFVDAERFSCEEPGVNLFHTTLTEQDRAVFLETPELIPSLYPARAETTSDSPAETELPLRECRVIFLGDGDSGKTYTIQRIRNGCRRETKDNHYPTQETPGVEILDHRVGQGADRFRIHFWDFGGQEILHSMHRCFLTRDACYVITVKSRETKGISGPSTGCETFRPSPRIPRFCSTSTAGTATTAGGSSTSRGCGRTSPTSWTWSTSPPGRRRTSCSGGS